jgi:hypothetical protein
MPGPEAGTGAGKLEFGFLKFGNAAIFYLAVSMMYISATPDNPQQTPHRVRLILATASKSY